ELCGLLENQALDEIAALRAGLADRDATIRGLRDEWTEGKVKVDARRGVGGDHCAVGNNCGRVGCPECQQ
ncbi:MAG TPA: hypothetical protein VGM56_17865, partial [Byssovorax sp.]